MSHADHAAGRFVPVSGKLPNVSHANRERIAVYLLRGHQPIATAKVGKHGDFRFRLAGALTKARDVQAVLAPIGADPRSLSTRADLPRLALSQASAHGEELRLDFTVDDAIIDPWWLWCRPYTISGSLDTLGNCPIGATVTIYNVTTGAGGLVKNPLATVKTDANGDFTATFYWCSRLCLWPCWPEWFLCWPWWWELDILTVLDALERQLQTKLPGTTAPINTAPIRQPDSADLAVGLGFAASRPAQTLVQDPARTALIASKFANPALRAIFPWWWWCCDNPNIVFSASQGANMILDEDPNSATRWCCPSGQNFALTGNNLSVGACPVTGDGNCAFAWVGVGSEPGVAIGDITLGYSNGSGACSNVAFAGSLYLNGNFTGSCAAYYQVLVGAWGGDPARGGSAPMSAAPLSSPTQLINSVSIWRNSSKTMEVDNVVMGPLTYNNVDDLYVTPFARQSLALPASVLAQIGDFPTITGADFLVGWGAPTLVAVADAGSLVVPNNDGGVMLSIEPYDDTGTAIPISTPPMNFDLGPALTLTIDTTPLTTAQITSVVIYNSDGTAASQTTVSSTECPAYQITTATGYALVNVTVFDTNGHLCKYYIQTQYGHGLTVAPVPADRDYAQSASTFTPPGGGNLYGVGPSYGVPNNTNPPTLPLNSTVWSFTGGSDTIMVPINQTCCYDFQLWASKRTTDGQTFACVEAEMDFQTVNVIVGT